jgi:hypothetical protein
LVLLRFQGYQPYLLKTVDLTLMHRLRHIAQSLEKLEIVVDGGEMSRNNFYRLAVALRPEMARFHRVTLPRMSGTIQTTKKGFSSSGF